MLNGTLIRNISLNSVRQRRILQPSSLAVGSLKMITDFFSKKNDKKRSLGTADGALPTKRVSSTS